MNTLKIQLAAQILAGLVSNPNYDPESNPYDLALKSMDQAEILIKADQDVHDVIKRKFDYKEKMQEEHLQGEIYYSEKELHEISVNMRSFGGGFVSQLAELLPKADMSNRRKLVAAFPDLFKEYADPKWNQK